MKNSLHNSFWQRLGVLFATALSVCGCGTICEELPGCRISVDFRYDYNMSGEDLFAAQCDKVEIFVFDARGVLQYRNAESGASLALSGYRMPVPIEYGDYTLIAWAGYKDSYELSDAQIGVSTLDELTLRLKRGADNSHASELEPLWYGMERFTYTGVAERVVTVPLLKNTNKINLKLVNTTQFPDMPIEHVAVRLTASNGLYGFDNALQDDAPITYLPLDRSVGSVGTMLHVLNTMRLIEDAEMSLSVVDVNSGNSLLPSGENLNLTDYLLRTCPETMTAQEYLDRQDLWDIEIGYTRDPNKGFLVVVIKINDWVVWNQGTDL